MGTPPVSRRTSPSIMIMPSPRQSATLAAAALAFGVASLLIRDRPPRVRSWKRRVAIVTGGARGLGFAIAEELANNGAVVWLVSRNPEELARAVERLGATGGDAHAHVADVTDPEAVAHLVEAVAARHGRIDVVVNNAGVITAMPFDNAELADFDESLATHFWGPLYVIRAALPWLRRARPGHIINVSSIGGLVGVPHLAPYCAGKFALTGLSQVLRAELAPDDVWVTTATPGLMRTGSVGRVRVRGAHVPEARWFAALSATSLTSKNATAAARQIVAAARRGRATITSGWQAKAQHVVNTLAPELTAAALAVVTAHLLPAPTAVPSPSRPIDSLDLGWAEALVSERTAVQYNQR